MSKRRGFWFAKDVALKAERVILSDMICQLPDHLCLGGFLLIKKCIWRLNMKYNQIGRSMVEMLGVLAIIAVLSVGGIAGYSKAMQAWKINQSLKEYSSLVFGMLEHIDEIHRIEQEKNAQYGLVTMAEALNLIPQQWDCGEKVRECTDKQGNTIRIFGRNNRLVIDFYLGGYTWTGKNSVISQNFNPKLCEEIAAKIFQPLHSMMYTGYIVEQNLYGDAFCGKNIPCIKDVSLSTINQLCNACTEDNSGCALVLTY